MPAAVAVEGLPELQRAFRQIDAGLQKQLRAELAEAAEPARTQAERFAVENISHIGQRWSQMRLGVTARYVYLAPKARRRGGSPRKNLGTLLLQEAMWPAAEDKRPEVEARLELWLDRLGVEAGF